MKAEITCDKKVPKLQPDLNVTKIQFNMNDLRGSFNFSLDSVFLKFHTTCLIHIFYLIS